MNMYLLKMLVPSVSYLYADIEVSMIISLFYWKSSRLIHFPNFF